MTSYEVGFLYGYTRGLSWKNKEIDDKLVKGVSKNEFVQKNPMFDGLVEQDFIEGYIDGLETAIKNQKIVVV